MKLTVGGLLLASACLFLAAWLVIGWITRLQWLGLAAGALLAFVPFHVRPLQGDAGGCGSSRSSFPDAIDLIARALRAGHAFTTGLALVAEEAPQPVAGEFRLLYDQQNFGMPLADALKAFAERLPLLDARFFVTAVLTQRESGGNLAEILGNLANVIRERFKVKRQVRVISAHGRITGWVLSGLPPSLAAAFMITSPNHIMTLVERSAGRQHDSRRAVPADCRDADHPEARRHRVLTRKMTMTPELMLALGALFVSVAFAAGYVAFEVLRRRAPARQRLHAAAGGSVLATNLPLAAGELDPRLARANRFLPKSPKDMSRLQKRMARAGYRSPMAPVVYSICELGLPLILLVLCVYFLGTTRGLFIGALAAIIGYMLPGFWLSRQTEKRKKLIANGLPDALDLLIVCVEAGMGLDQAHREGGRGAGRVAPGARRKSSGSSRPRFAPASLEWKRSRTSPSARRSTTCASSCRCWCRRIGSGRASRRRFARRRR